MISHRLAGGRHLVTYEGRATFSHSDWLGTERLGVTAAYINQPQYDEPFTSYPFGDGFTGQTGGYATALHFTGQPHDLESNLEYFGARYDSSSMARFLSPDRNNVGAAATNPQSWNGYAYALSNPLNNEDPDGLATSACVDDGYGSKNCVYYSNDNDFDKAVANSPGVSAQDGKIFATVDGKQVQVGTYIQDRGTFQDDIIAPSLFFGAAGAVRSVFRGGVAMLGDLFGVGGRAAEETISGLYGTVSREALEAAANSGGQTIRVVTNLTQAPAAGRALSVATGEGAEALANAAREGGTTYVANIPKALLDQLKNAGLAFSPKTSMGGAVAQEVRFAPQAAEFVVKFFRAVN